MSIANWIFKVADESVEEIFPEKDYKDLLSKYKKGELKEVEASAVEEITYLLQIINSVIPKLINSKIEAAETLRDSLPAEKLPERKILPGKQPEPSSTKWKEIRFNKKDSKWQVISNVRTVRNFNSEEEALEFAKKV